MSFQDFAARFNTTVTTTIRCRILDRFIEDNRDLFRGDSIRELGPSGLVPLVIDAALSFDDNVLPQVSH